jgi:hypothetical protein
MKNCFLILITTFVLSVTLRGQVVLNEMMSANYNRIVDQDNEYNDWLELYNTSSSSVNLSGYYLSDDIDNLKKWVLPDYVLQSHAFLLVFASGKDISDPPVYWNTIIKQGDNWKFIIPTTNIGTSWQTASFNDAGWTTGASGFGNGDSDDATTTAIGSNIFIRKTFDIADKTTVKRLVLHVDYDDGFVAYINGVEVARMNVGSPGQPVAYNAFASSDHEAQMYQGGQPDVFEISNIESLLVNGTNVLAIQGHNNSSSSSDFTLIPYLTIGTTNYSVSDWVHPYFSASQSYFHTNFKLSNEGEALYLSSPAGVVVSDIAAVPLDGDISYGLQPDGSSDFVYFASSTPGKTNNDASGTTNQRADSVIFSVDGGNYPSGTTLVLSSPVATDEIYYTKDGSIPTVSSIKYSSPIAVSADCVIKACLFRSGALPGPVVTHTYVVSKKHKFPITSLSTEPANLWDNQTGIYVKGPNAESENPYHGANFWQDWEKPAQLEVFDASGTNVINQGVGIKIYGAWTRANDQKSMAIFARKNYGKGSLEYRFFDDKAISKFESLVFRNSGNDFKYTQFRDGLMTGLARKMNVDRQGFKPSAHYLNGQYWGILNIREKINEHFVADNHQFDTEEVSILSNNNEVVMGTSEDYVSMLSFVNTQNLQTSDNYKQVLNKIDVDNYIQYQFTQIYIDNQDWPGNNIKFWRSHAAESKWRWILYDTDFGFGLYGSSNFNNNTLTFAMDATKTDWPNPAWSTLLFRRLLTSTEFRNNFITQYSDHLNTTFQSAAVNAQIDSLKSLFEGEIQFHLNKWGQSYASWISEVNRLKSFAGSRPTNAWNHLQSAFNLGARLNVTVGVDNAASGRVKLNSIILDQATFNGTYFANIPIKLKALPKPGYKFVRWEGSVVSGLPEISYEMAQAGNFKAIFAPAVEANVQIVINEINYKSASNFDTGDWIELYNQGSATVDLGGWELTDSGAKEAYIFPSGTILYPGDYLVICENLTQFKNHRPNTSNSMGNFAFGLSSNGDKVELYNSSGQLADAVVYQSVSPWPVIDAEAAGTLELMNPNSDNAVGTNWAVYKTYGTPGRQNNGAVITPPVDPIDPAPEPEPPLVDKAVVCFPNPFKDFTTIEFTISSSRHYAIDIYDMNGRIVKHLLNQTLEPDVYSIDWNGTGADNQILSNGIYFIRCTSSEQTEIMKVLKITD